MGNHSFLCPDCGRDQRSYGGSRCCDAARDRHNLEVAARRAQFAERKLLLDHHGIEYHVCGIYGEPVVKTESVVAFLAGLRTQ